MYGLPCATRVVKVNAPLVMRDKSSPRLFCSTTVPTSPLMVPPMVYVLGEQLIETLVTSAEPMVPEPLVTMQVRAADTAVTA